MDFLTSYLPQSDGLLPKWLLFVRPAPNSLSLFHILTKKGLHRLSRKQHPSLHNPQSNPKSLPRPRKHPSHTHLNSLRHKQSSNASLGANIRNMDFHNLNCALVCCILYFESTNLSISFCDVCSCFWTFCE